jgi:DNA-binding winged helix-turn-helix (wHTH) protein
MRHHYRGGLLTHEFDDFALDVGTRRLLRHGQEVHLSPKALDLLSVLIEHRERAMSKADLLDRLWPSTYVADTNLAGLVAELRRALGDSADDSSYVRTVQRFGYWFIGKLKPGANGDEPGQRPAKFWLMWETRQISLNPDENILGRAADAEVWLDAPGVSRHHARITVGAEDAILEDLGSKNGTYLRGLRLTAPSRLADGDQIRLGSVVITFRVPGPAALTETASM